MKNALFYGLLASVANFGYSYFLLSLGYYTDKMGDPGVVGMVGFIIIIVGIGFAMRVGRDQAQEEGLPYGYGKCFGVGVMTSLVMAIMGTVFAYIFYNYVHPGMTDFILSQQANAMAEQGAPQEQIAKWSEVMRGIFEGPILLVISFVFTLLPGTLISLVMALVFKAKTQET